LVVHFRDLVDIYRIRLERDEHFLDVMIAPFSVNQAVVYIWGYHVELFVIDYEDTLRAYAERLYNFIAKMDKREESLDDIVGELTLCLEGEAFIIVKG